VQSPGVSPHQRRGAGRPALPPFRLRRVRQRRPRRQPARVARGQVPCGQVLEVLRMPSQANSRLKAPDQNSHSASSGPPNRQPGQLIDPGDATTIPIGVLRRRLSPTRFSLTGAAPATAHSWRHSCAAPPSQKRSKLSYARFLGGGNLSDMMRCERYLSPSHSVAVGPV
jgi:hypothetical protein